MPTKIQNQPQELPVTAAVIPVALDDAGLSVYEFRVLCHVLRRASISRWFKEARQEVARVCKISNASVSRAFSGLVNRRILAPGSTSRKYCHYLLLDQDQALTEPSQALTEPSQALTEPSQALTELTLSKVGTEGVLPRSTFKEGWEESPDPEDPTEGDGTLRQVPWKLCRQWFSVFQRSSGGAYDEADFSAAWNYWDVTVGPNGFWCRGGTELRNLPALREKFLNSLDIARNRRLSLARNGSSRGPAGALTPYAVAVAGDVWADGRRVERLECLGWSETDFAKQPPFALKREWERLLSRRSVNPAIRRESGDPMPPDWAIEEKGALKALQERFLAAEKVRGDIKLQWV